MKVLEFPLTKINIGFVLGIVFANYYKPDITAVFSVLLASFSLFAVVFLVTNKRQSHPLFFGFSIVLLSFTLGNSTQCLHTDSYRKSNYTNSPELFEKPHLISITIREELKHTKTNFRYIALVHQIDGNQKTGKILLNIRKLSLNIPYEVGANLWLNTRIIKNTPPKNPNTFDYGAYLERNQIYAQLFSSVTEIKKRELITKDIWYYAAQLRTKIIRNLENNQFHKNELSVATALLLGQKQELSPEIVRDYQFAGAVHILAISGLHIGILLWFLYFILQPIPNNRKAALLKLVIVILSLSSFAILAGLSPSVLRSVTMFSFVAIGIYLRRSTYIYHTLLISALLILLFKPSFLFEVGFQLSYIALFFILWLQPLLVQIWQPKNKIANYFWQILTVSIAAQIGVLPLTLYYFHQFPGLFFVSNLAVIPLLSLLMPLGVVVLSLAAFDIAPLYLSKLLEWGIYLLNKIINWIASFEDFVIQEIPFNWQLLLSIYFLLIAVVFWFKKPSFSRLSLAFIAIIGLQLSCIHVHYSIQNQKELIVFHTKNETLVVERNGKKAIAFTNDTLQDSLSKNKMCTSYLTAHFSHLKAQEKLGNLLYFNNKKILIMDSLGVYPKNIKPDIVLLTQSPKINLDRLLQTLQPKIVVADASNYKNLQEAWAKTCSKAKTPFHATAEKGFYRLD